MSVEQANLINSNGDVVLSAEHANLIKDSKPANLTEYHLGQIMEWALQPSHLDKRFVNLTLLLDSGERRGHRWQNAEDFRFNNLRDVLKATEDDPVVMLLGAPGSGKTTLLRRLQLDHSVDRLRDNTEGVAFFIQLHLYRVQANGELPDPREWLNTRWAARYPALPPLETFLQQGRTLLLLDALNEMPHKITADYFKLVSLWRAFAQKASREGNRILFSCRSLDYSASLSSPDLRVPQIDIQPMSANQVRNFLTAYIAPSLESQVWAALDGSPQFSLFQTPFFLKLLCEQVEVMGTVSQGRAEMFTDFVRQALKREINTEVFQLDTLFSERDRQKLSFNKWLNPFDLPEDGVLIPKISNLAFSMQLKNVGTSGVSGVPYEKVLVSNRQLCSCGDAWANSSNLEAAD
ncbi:MAG: NACHT domain-containing protein, partial [Anaerolineae bacterium]|nr:NACHT domain-containing protein [Anaerolineae bacterium]